MANMIATTSAISALVFTVAILCREVQGHGYTVIAIGAGFPVAMRTNTTSNPTLEKSHGIASPLF